MKELIISIEGVSLLEFFGANNTKLALLKRSFPRLKIISRGNQLKAIGNEDDIELFLAKVDGMLEFLRKYGSLSELNIKSMLEGVQPAEVVEATTSKSTANAILHGPHGNTIRARTPNQRNMVSKINDNDILFAIGPAGTGKTYTAVALAVKALKNKIVKKIVLTRPAVEAGEKLGFLPGDLKDKVDPYLRPLYDALDDMIPVDKLNYYMANRIIEIAPLAFMRGRTLDNSFIILDEAQNATNLQLKMFLTRIGPSAKAIITGDLTQVDLPKYQKSGLGKSLDILKGIKGIAMVYLSQEDVVRHNLVKQIIIAYEKADQKREESKEAQKG